MPKPPTGTSTGVLRIRSSTRPPTTTNSNLLQHRRPSRCRTDLGIVTCPLIVTVVVTMGAPR